MKGELIRFFFWKIDHYSYAIFIKVKRARIDIQPPFLEINSYVKLND